MKKEKFEEIKETYERRRRRLENINVGDMVWEYVGRGLIGGDYHPAIVMGVDIDENCIKVIDVSSDNEIKKYHSFLTKEQMLQHGFTEKNLDDEKERYSDIIKKVINQ